MVRVRDTQTGRSIPVAHAKDTASAVQSVLDSRSRVFLAHGAATEAIIRATEKYGTVYVYVDDERKHVVDVTQDPLRVIPTEGLRDV